LYFFMQILTDSLKKAFISAIHFRHDENGGIAVQFAVGLTMLVLLLGIALDTARMVKSDKKLQDAVDVAALAGRKAILDDVKDWKKVAETAFSENTSDIRFMSKPSIKVTRIDKDTVGVDVSADIESTFMSAFDYPKLGIAAYSEANMATPIYTRVTVLVDTSYSMGIGATEADQTLMISATNCAFACHMSDPWQSSTYAGARATNATLRIDVVKEALDDFIADLRRDHDGTNLVEFALYRFGHTAENLLAPTTDFNAMQVAVSKVGLTKDPEFMATDISTVIDAATLNLPLGGAGTSPTDRKSIVILLTDGVDDVDVGLVDGTGDHIYQWITNPDFDYNTSYKERVQSPDIDLCRSLKTRKHDIYVMETEYIIPTGGSMTSGNLATLDYLEDSLLGEIESNLKACASNGNFVKTTDPAEIKNALSNIYSDIFPTGELRVSR